MNSETKKMPSTKLLTKAVDYSSKAYDENIDGAVKIESKLTSSTAFFVKDKDIGFDVLVFRGTQQARDWLFNLSALPIFYGGRWVHSGFAAAHTSIWRQIKTCINPKKRLLITGHSLGGGLAELSAVKLAKECDYKNISLITFGKPNTFLKRKNRYAMGHLEAHLSVISGSDIVAKIPKFFYCPDANQMSLYLANDGQDYVNCKREFMVEDWSVKDAVSDHSMGLYEERMKPHTQTKGRAKK
jgi:triacylglycerol lipase